MAPLLPHAVAPTPARRGALRLLAPLAVLAALAPGCTTASAIALQPSRVTVQAPLEGTVRVDAVGSARRGGIGPRAIRGDDLAHAIRGTLLASGACGGVVESGAADHVLRVEVLDVTGSELQLDMEATVVARWTLYDPTGRIASWQETIATHGKASTFDAGMVEDRARMALEHATRENITEGVERLDRRAAAPK